MGGGAVKFTSATLRRTSISGRIAGPGTVTGNFIGPAFDFYVTGHGSYPDYYARLSWQDASANGNPAANEGCNNCHDLNFPHITSSVKPLNQFHGFYPFFHIKKGGNNEMP